MKRNLKSDDESDSLVPQKDSFDYLKEIIEVMSESEDESISGIINTTTAVELTLQALMPESRKRMWDYLEKVRKKIGNKVFEDEEDYLDFIQPKNIKF